MPAGSSSSEDSNGAVSWRQFARRMPERLRAFWRLKLALAITLGPLFTIGYLLIGHFPLLPVHTLPLTWVDRVAGFHPTPWVWVYQSVYLPMNLIPWLAERRDELHRYVRGFILLAAVSFAVFILAPTRAPKPVVIEPRGMYEFLQMYDAPNNALPSLHVGILAYTFAFGRRILRREMPPRVGAACVVWGLMIAYSTLATKQHYFVDLPVGAALGIAAHCWAWRPSRGVTLETVPQPEQQRRPAAQTLPARS